jgi:hypothetical protein
MAKSDYNLQACRDVTLATAGNQSVSRADPRLTCVYELHLHMHVLAARASKSGLVN